MCFLDPWKRRKGLSGLDNLHFPPHPRRELTGHSLTILAVELDHQVAAAATEGDAALLHSLLHHRQRAEDGQEGLGRIGHQPGTVPP